jgi:hypothetical protein
MTDESNLTLQILIAGICLTVSILFMSQCGAKNYAESEATARAAIQHGYMKAGYNEFVPVKATK